MPAPGSPRRHDTDPLAVGVLAVQGDVREHLRVLTALGANAFPVRRAAELDAAQALVIPGGESTVIDKLTHAFGLFDPIRARLAAGMPAYGSCAGMIMLADAVVDATADQRTFGGMDITVRRNAFGRQVDSFEADLLVAGVADERVPVRAVFIRAPWVERVGPGVEVLATVVRDGRPAVVAARQGGLLVTAFHPEVTGDSRIHQLFLDLVVQHAAAGTSATGLG